MANREKMLEGIDLQRDRGIEIGALGAPIVTKAEANIRYIDWTDQQTLVAKYANDTNVDTAKIVPVDAIWGDLSLKESLRGESGFGYAIASHVIEHVPDMIGWLGEIAEVLRPGGRLTLAIPDRRFTFDYLRQSTRVGDLIDAWMRRNRRPAPSSVYDHVANVVAVDATAAWSGSLDSATLIHFNDPRSALTVAREALEGIYHDVHCWVFTPESLFRIMIDLVDLDLLPYRCARFHPTEPGSIDMVLILERLAGNTETEKAEARTSFVRGLAAASVSTGPVTEVHRLRSDIQNLKERIAILEADAAALRASTSWRITRPLRSIKMRVSGSAG